MKKPNLFSRLFRDDDGNIERPFFFFLTLVLVGIYIWALFDSPALDSAWKIVLFTVLMNIHIALYWISPILIKRPRWLSIILIVQGVLVFSIGVLTRVVGITLGLYPGLIGLVIGLPVRRIWRVLMVGYMLTLSLSNYLFLAGPQATLWWAVATIPITLFVAIYVLLYQRQAEAREKAQSLLRDLEVANRQLSEYAARVEDLTIAAERQRMARELHDTLSQGLAGLILQLEAVDAHLASDRPGRAREILQPAMQKARLTLTEARQVIDDLRQPTGQDLADAVRGEAEHFSVATGIACEPQIELGAAVPELVAEAAVRAVAEGLTNIARHAQAQRVSLRVATNLGTKELQIEIQDDGIGFNPEEVEAGHYGLLGMRERVRFVGGSLEVDSAPGQGTQIVIRFPLADGGGTPPGA